MGAAAGRGAAAGGAFGLVVAVLLALLVVGTGDAPGFADAEDLPVAYVVIAVAGLLLGAVYGAITVAVGLAVARGAGRGRGAVVAGVVAGVLGLVSPIAVVGPFVLVGLVLLALVGGATTYALLPGLLDRPADTGPPA